MTNADFNFICVRSVNIEMVHLWAKGAVHWTACRSGSENSPHCINRELNFWKDVNAHHCQL